MGSKRTESRSVIILAFGMNRQDFVDLTQKWYVVENDIVGGWAISPYDKPLSEHNTTSSEPERYIADAMSKRTAAHIVEIHNSWLNRIADVVAAFKSEMGNG